MESAIEDYTDKIIVLSNGVASATSIPLELHYQRSSTSNSAINVDRSTYLYPTTANRDCLDTVSYKKLLHYSPSDDVAIVRTISSSSSSTLRAAGDMSNGITPTTLTSAGNCQTKYELYKKGILIKEIALSAIDTAYSAPPYNDGYDYLTHYLPSIGYTSDSSAKINATIPINKYDDPSVNGAIFDGELAFFQLNNYSPFIFFSQDDVAHPYIYKGHRQEDITTFLLTTVSCFISSKGDMQLFDYDALAGGLLATLTTMNNTTINASQVVFS